MIYGTILQEQISLYEKDTVFEMLTENMNLSMEYCLSEMQILSEVHIPDDMRNPKKKTMIDRIKEFISKLWKSFKEWEKGIRVKIKDKIAKIRSKFGGKSNTSSASNDSSSNNKTEQPKEEKKYINLNDKFDKVDESKLISDKVIDLSQHLVNYNKNIFENYDNSAYIKETTSKVTNGLYDSIDDLKADDLVEETTIKPDVNTLNNLNKKYDKMISEVDAYFNSLQDSIRKAEQSFNNLQKKNMANHTFDNYSYSDDRVSASTSNFMDEMRIKKIFPVYVKMIGAQSGIVRNIVYTKVAAINKVLEHCL